MWIVVIDSGEVPVRTMAHSVLQYFHVGLVKPVAFRYGDGWVRYACGTTLTLTAASTTDGTIVTDRVTVCQMATKKQLLSWVPVRHIPT